MLSARRPWDPTKDPGAVRVAVFAFVVSNKKTDSNSGLVESQYKKGTSINVEC